jgi:hypothetical protein
MAIAQERLVSIPSEAVESRQTDDLHKFALSIRDTLLEHAKTHFDEQRPPTKITNTVRQETYGLSCNYPFTKIVYTEKRGKLREWVIEAGISTWDDKFEPYPYFSLTSKGDSEIAILAHRGGKYVRNEETGLYEDQQTEMQLNSLDVGQSEDVLSKFTPGAPVYKILDFLGLPTAFKRS